MTQQPTTRFGNHAVRWLALGCLVIAEPPAAWSQACTSDQLAAAVDQAGAKLREITQTTQPKLEAKLLALKAKRGWGGADADEKAYEALADERTTELDRTSNELLAKIDTLGALSAKETPECRRIQDIETASLELQAAVKAKAQYMLSRADSLIADRPPAADKPAETSVAAPQAPAPIVPKTTAPVVIAAPLPAPAAKAPPRPPAGPWSTTTTADAQPPGATAPQPAASAPVFAPPIEDDAFTIDEITRASTGYFGKVSAGLGSIVEHAFGKAGKPAGYILGTEGGGAFLAGLRYGSGTLYLRSGGTMPIHWHGPSFGADIGASGSKVMFLAYGLYDVEQLWKSFTGVEGSAYLAGGLGFTLMTNGDVKMAPIRSGVGLRLGANVGYIRFTRRPTWNPF